MQAVSSAAMAGCDSLLSMANKQTRRNFLLKAPLAALVASPLADTMLRASTAGSSAMAQPDGPGVQVFTATEMAGELNGVQAKHGTKNLLTTPGTLMILSEETKKAAKEFEWHATRDHVFQVLDGETKYELGGTPKGAHQTKPGEWLAPESEGAKTVILKKGDYLFVPRMTPHKRTTDQSVSLLLISSQTPA
jgi:mannose-6-phosphate isomerase-like protein (cupin superfamily)